MFNILGDNAGVKEHACFMKELADSERVRFSRISTHICIRTVPLKKPKLSNTVWFTADFTCNVTVFFYGRTCNMVRCTAIFVFRYNTCRDDKHCVG